MQLLKSFIRRILIPGISYLRLSCLILMAQHSKLQRYRKHHVTTCITGLFGCRWKRYQQSVSPSRKIDFIHYSYFLAVLILATLSCYFWIIGKNDYDDMAWHLYKSTGNFLHIYKIFLGVTCFFFCYASLLLMLSFCHVALHYQLYLHWFHTICLTLIMAATIAITAIIRNMWKSAPALFSLSFLMTGPFLHILLVVTSTLLFWLLIDKILQLHHIVPRAVWLTVFAIVLFVIYLLPVFIASSPCICSNGDLPPKPAISAHRGASGIAPENTQYAIELASQFNSVIVLETDLSVSLDGKAFLIHDTDLKRTTNVASVFPARKSDLSSSFNYSDLAQLDAGTWFLKTNPHETVSQLTKSEKDIIRQQTIPLLSEILELVKISNKSFMLDMDTAFPESHPFMHTYADVIIRTILESGVPQEKVLWLYSKWNTTVKQNFTVVAGKNDSVEDLYKLSNMKINVAYDKITQATLRNFKSRNLTVNVWTVNVDWLFSLLWCMGVDSVTTNFAHHYDAVTQPVWHLTPGAYAAIATVTDLLSVAIVVFLFIRARRLHTPDNPLEVYTLKVADRREQKRNMQQKLILEHKVGSSRGVFNQITPDLEDSGNDIYTEEQLDNSTVSQSSTRRKKSSSKAPGNLEFFNEQYVGFGGSPRLEIMMNGREDTESTTDSVQDAQINQKDH